MVATFVGNPFRVAITNSASVSCRETFRSMTQGAPGYRRPWAKFGYAFGVATVTSTSADPAFDN
jgi:hypothetical protein